MNKSQRIGKKAIERCNCHHILPGVEVHRPHLPFIVHFRNGALGYCLGNSHLLIVQFVLGIAALQVNQMETVIIAASHYGATFS